MHRAIIYDLDGVIRHWDADETRSIEERHGLPPGAILAVAFEPALLERAVCGHIDDPAWREAIGEVLVRAHGPGAAAAMRDWCQLTGAVDREMLALVAETRARLRTGLLTNATTRLEADLELLGLRDCFDQVVSSARVGLAKPDPRIYRVAAERLGHRPEECIFVDDRAAFVDAAREIGLTGIVFVGAADLRARLARLAVR
jgi:putative hydrolase of the HAD superfamily